MKPLMILGAVIGFVIGSGFALAGNNPWPQVLWRASVAALAAGWLTRWWSRAWVRGLREALEEQRPPQAAVPATPKATPRV